MAFRDRMRPSGGRRHIPKGGLIGENIGVLGKQRRSRAASRGTNEMVKGSRVLVRLDASATMCANGAESVEPNFRRQIA